MAIRLRWTLIRDMWSRGWVRRRRSLARSRSGWRVIRSSRWPISVSRDTQEVWRNDADTIHREWLFAGGFNCTGECILMLMRSPITAVPKMSTSGASTEVSPSRGQAGYCCLLRKAFYLVLEIPASQPRPETRPCPEDTDHLHRLSVVSTL